MGGVVNMSKLVQELEMLKRRVVTARRTSQRPPLNKQQKNRWVRSAWAFDRELSRIDLNEELVTEEFLETVDDYEDDLSTYELQAQVNFILSSVDVCVCSNAFVVPADSYEIQELPPMWNTVTKNRGHREFTLEQEAYMEELKRRRKRK